VGELREETGLQAACMDKLGFMYLSYGYTKQGMHVFLASALAGGEPSPSLEEAGIRTRRIGVEELRGLIRSGEIVDAATLAAFALLEEQRRSRSAS
jgi:ADP-ribose pyrophosphatase